MIEMFFDTEFTGLRKNTDLISIGCTFRNGNYFYGEIKGVDLESPEIGEDTKKFLKREVYPGLMFIGKSTDDEDDVRIPDMDEYAEFGENTICYGSKEFVGGVFCAWVSAWASHQTIVPVSDVMYYDMILLMDLIHSAKPNEYADEKAISAAKDIVVPVGIDLNDNIRKALKIYPYEAFDINREELANKVSPGNPIMHLPTKKHNALYDARVIRVLYDGLAHKYPDMEIRF